jgi:two-component SAPR family response regulator
MPESNSAEAADDLRGFCVLIVEDDSFFAQDEGDWLERIGCKVLGPMTSVPAALDALEKVLPDGAVLDIDVCGTAIYPVARRLVKHNVPFMFVSASDPATIDENFKSVPRLMKPIGEYQLQHAALRVFSAAKSRRPH